MNDPGLDTVEHTALTHSHHTTHTEIRQLVMFTSISHVLTVLYTNVFGLSGSRRTQREPTQTHLFLLKILQSLYLTLDNLVVHVQL